MTPCFLHIPHSSRLIPEVYRDTYLKDPATELPFMTDSFTDELFDAGLDRLIFPVSRLVCDPERFRDDRDEPMAKVGMGAVYTSCHDLTPLRTVSKEDREAILSVWYDPHHLKLAQMVRERLAVFGGCLIIDCHSFSKSPLPYEKDLPAYRPGICIGTDPFHTPPELIEAFLSSFRRLGYEAAVNTPYSGCMIPAAFWRKDRRVTGIMIEVNRGLYLTEKGARNSHFDQLKQDLDAVIRNAVHLYSQFCNVQKRC